MLSLRHPAATIVRGTVRTFAKKGVAVVKATSSPKTKIQTEELEAKVHGLNIYKGGLDPETLSDSEYPNWVFEIHKSLPGLDELTKKYELEGPGAMTDQEQRLMIKRWNRARILQRNSELSK